VKKPIRNQRFDNRNCTKNYLEGQNLKVTENILNKENTEKEKQSPNDKIQESFKNVEDKSNVVFFFLFFKLIYLVDKKHNEI